MRPFDSVVLKEDFPEFDLVAGTEAAIVEMLGDGEAFVIECFDGEGNTLAVVEARAEQLTLVLADFFDGERVALVESLPGVGLQRGQVGRIVRRTGVGVYEVEFADAQGVIFAEVKLHAHQLLLLHWTPTHARLTA